MQTLDELLNEWTAQHGYTLIRLMIYNRLTHRIEIRVNRQDDIVDVWWDEDGTVAIDFVNGRTGICGSRNCTIDELSPTLDRINRELKDIDQWANFGLP